MQAGPDAFHCHRRCPELDLTQGLAVIRASAAERAGSHPFDDITYSSSRQSVEPSVWE